MNEIKTVIERRVERKDRTEVYSVVSIPSGRQGVDMTQTPHRTVKGPCIVVNLDGEKVWTRSRAKAAEACRRAPSEVAGELAEAALTSSEIRIEIDDLEAPAPDAAQRTKDKPAKKKAAKKKAKKKKAKKK